MKLIPLSGKYGAGKFAQVDDEDYDFLIKFKWFAAKQRNTFYANRKVSVKEKLPRSIISMHTMLMNPKKGTVTDHKDMNGLNNQRDNLRYATFSQNAQNRNLFGGKSKYKGVVVSKRGSTFRWAAIIAYGNIRKSLGTFPYTEEGEKSAALLYNEAAKIYHGEFAKLNKVDGQTEIINTEYASQYIGVSEAIKNKYKYWVSRIQVNGKSIRLGLFPYTPKGEIDAALTYNKAAVQYRGVNTKLNIIV